MSKTPLLRLRTSQYYELCLTPAFIETNFEQLDQFLIISTADLNQEVRNQARYCCSIYFKQCREKCINMIINGVKSASIKKQISMELGIDLNAQVRQVNSRQMPKSPIRHNQSQLGH